MNREELQKHILYLINKEIVLSKNDCPWRYAPEFAAQQIAEMVVKKCHIADVTNRYLFFYEGEEDGWTFEIEAKDYEEAFELAYDTHGPQVEMMMYRLI